MVKLKLIVLLLMVVAVAAAQEKVNHLVYKSENTVENKKGKEVIPGMGTEININDKQVVVTRLREDGTLNKTLGTRIYDRKNNVVIYDMYERELYLIETFDSITGPDIPAKDLGKTATIADYKCKAYALSVGYYMMGKLMGTYDYVVWVTDELVTDDASNDQILSALTSNIARFDYKGTVVKVEIAFTTANGKRTGYCEVELTKANNTEKANELAKMPWLKDDVKAMLPSKDGFGTSYTYTAEKDYTVAYKRMRELLTKVTGIEKPKSIGLALPRPVY